MAGGYRHDPEGEDRFAKRVTDVQEQVDSLRGRSGVKNAILRGDVLTFQSLAGALTARIGEFVAKRFDYPNWVADTIRGLQLTKAGDDEPFAHIAHAVDADRVDVILGFGDTALSLIYAQTGEFWISGPGNSQFYIDPSGEVTISAAVGQVVNVTGQLQTSADIVVGDDLVVSDDLTVNGNVGFYGTSPQGKPTVSGSRASGAALNDLLNELANLGLITNSTSA